MGRLDGKVAVITGGARGQGRSHAVTFAREGADIVISDIAEQLPTVPYPGASQADLDETVRLVEDLDRRCVAVKADVRDEAAMQSVADRAMDEFGQIDILLANAGIFCVTPSSWELTLEQWNETVDTNLTGVWLSCKTVIPHMIAGGRGGSIVITSSTAGIKGFAGAIHYVAAKHGVIGIMRTLANELASHSIRVNTVHPTGVNSPMIANDWFNQWAEGNEELAGGTGNLLPVDLVETYDISNAMLWLCSDEARYVTGVMLPVDAGSTQK